jgi:hypothetical protein
MRTIENGSSRQPARIGTDENGSGCTKRMIGTDKAEVSAEEKTLELFVSRCMADALSISIGQFLTVLEMVENHDAFEA